MAHSARSASDFDATGFPSIVAGIGCRRGADAAEIIALVEQALSTAGHSAATLVAMASLDRKADEPGLIAAAGHFGVPLRTFSANQLNAAAVDASSRIRALVGTSSVAETAAALAGDLVVSKLKSDHVTCALAVAGPEFDLARFGHAVPGRAPSSTASMAASRSLTSNAGP